MRSVLSAERGVRNAEYKAKSEAPQILDMRSGTPLPGLPPPLGSGGQAGGRSGVVSAKSEGRNPKSEGSPKGETTENARTKAALKTHALQTLARMTKTRVIRIRWARGTDSAAPALRWASEWPQRGHFHHDPNAGACDGDPRD